jgi:protease secretion system membrane fusion protein
MVASRTFGDRRLQGNTVRAQPPLPSCASAPFAPAGLPQGGGHAAGRREPRGALRGAEFKALSDDLGRTEIKAPAAGQVVGLAVQTVGGVVAPGQKLMDIVPGNEALLLEVQVAPHLIDRVHADLPVDVRFSRSRIRRNWWWRARWYRFRGSADRPAFRHQLLPGARAVTPEGLKGLGKRQMQPGMPVEVVFKTGERSHADLFAASADQARGGLHEGGVNHGVLRRW